MLKTKLISKIGASALLAGIVVSFPPSIDLADAGLPAKATSHSIAARASLQKPVANEVPLNVSLHRFNKVHNDNHSAAVKNIELVSDPITSPSAKTIVIHNQEGKKPVNGSQTVKQNSSKVTGEKKQNATYKAKQQSFAKASTAKNEAIHKKAFTEKLATAKPNENNRKSSVTAKNETPNPDAKKTFQSSKATNSTSSSNSNVIAIAKSLIGSPYKLGGTSPSGFDCSGFVKYVFAKAGINLSRTANDMWYQNGTRVHSLQPGDLVFFTHTYQTSQTATHVGIYIGGGQFISAETESTGVRVSSLSGYWQSHYLGAKSVN